MKKKLADYTWEEVLLIDEFLYIIYDNKNKIPYKYLAERALPKISDISNYLSYLLENGYLKANPPSPLINYFENSYFDIETKGRIICKNGGLTQIYQNQKAEKKKSIRATWALIISGAAFLVSLATLLLVFISPMLSDNQ